MILKLKLILVAMILSIAWCEKKSLPVYQTMTCDTDYALNETYYDADADITIRLSYHWFSDTIGEIDYLAIDSSVDILNEMFEIAGIDFVIESTQEIVGEEKHDMPSYVKHARFYNYEGSINVYVYGDYQNNFPEKRKGVVGAAGGVPSTFFAIRKSWLKTVTVAHEAGHALGCYHIDTPDRDSTGTSSKSGDYVCDTPFSINIAEEVTSTCVYTGDRTYTPEELKIITCNIMSDAYAKCRGCFTEGQIQRMKWVIEQSSDLRECIKEPKPYF